MESDLTKFYLILLIAYSVFYVLSLVILELVATKMIVEPVFDLTQRMRKPKEMKLSTFSTRQTQSSGHFSGTIGFAD